ncbi:uncharacterized mitochondrial protein AtMg00810-like [Lactuca sativa]|uniref:uncharacterized mitochondrial protein AtMg00810-like n=1 Tax=Lactuca sativa TaxID=4236 RepID=UPI000CD89A78|nr:uncharacterized mitochondrial protein AtMg00810-like [Lactuca sativa]
MVEPKSIKEALEHADWITAIQEELAEFDQNEGWTLVPPPPNHPIVGTRWVFNNKLDDAGVIIRNKARFQVNPKMSHLLAVKQIFLHLKGTKSLRIWYPTNESFLLQAYSDSNYGGLQIDRKSTSSGCQFLGGHLVSWSSKKQICIALSTAEVEYIAAASCTS